MKSLRSCLPAWCVVVALLGGCSLVVDFDRSELVDAGVDGGFDLSDAGLDGGAEDAASASATADPEKTQPNAKTVSDPN